MNKEKLERVCLNCSQFLPSSMEEATEYGICLSDQDFEPYIDGLLDGSDYSSCRNLIDSKQFLAERDACEDFDEIEQITPCLIDELYKTPSNNTTRQWLTDIFRFFEYCPIGMIREPLEKMVKDKRFSYRLKKKMKSILGMNVTP